MSLFSSLDSNIHILLITRRYLSNNFPIDGVDHIEGLAGLGIDELAADEEAGREGGFSLVFTARLGKVVFKCAWHCWICAWVIV
jgi:hypothetical protein